MRVRPSSTRIKTGIVRSRRLQLKVLTSGSKASYPPVTLSNLKPNPVIKLVEVT